MPRRTLLRILLTFLLSRAFVFFFLIIGSQIAFLGKDYGNTIWRTETVVRAERIRPELTRMVMAGDAWHYERIAREGYPRPTGGAPSERWAFFPLYPLLVSVFADFAMGGVIVSNVAFLAALLLVAAAGLRLGATSEQVERAAFFLAFFPTSYFFSMPMTESLFLALTAGAFLLAAKERWWAAAILGALAAATRVFGVLLLPALLLLPLQQGRGLDKRQSWLLLIPAGTAAFMLHLQQVTGDPLAFIRAQSLWGRGSLEPIGFAISRSWNFIALNVAAAAFLLAAGLALVKQRQWAYAAYVLLAVAIPLSTMSVQSLARYSMVVFPAFLWLAQKEKNERAITATLVILLGWLLAMFVLRVDYALA